MEIKLQELRERSIFSVTRSNYHQLLLVRKKSIIPIVLKQKEYFLILNSWKNMKRNIKEK